MKTLPLEILTLERAKELTKAYDRVLNDHVLLINPVITSINTSGLTLGKQEDARIQAEQQEEYNKQGLLVVLSNDDKNAVAGRDNAHIKVYAGEKVICTQHPSLAFKITIKTGELLEGLDLKGMTPRKEHYKQYNLMCVHRSSIVCTLK